MPADVLFWHRPTRTNESRVYLGVLVLGIVGLNILATAKELQLVVHLVASVGLFIAGLPMWRYLARPREMLPFFPIISILYGVYFIVPIYMPFDPYWRFAGLPQEIVFETLLISVLGISVLVLSYAGVLPGISLRPRQLFPSCSVSKAWLGALVLGAVGLTAKACIRFLDVPTSIQSLFAFAGDLALLSLALLFLLKLTQSSPKFTMSFWLYLITLLLYEISTGQVVNLAKIFIMLTLVYVALRRTVPWKVSVLALAALLPFMALKASFRELTWEENKPGAASLLELPGQLAAYSEIIVKSAQTVSKDDSFLLVQRVSHRLDLLHQFSYYRELTPGIIPYLGGDTYASLWWKLIPRAFYRDKPTETLGQDTGHLYGLVHESDDKTSINFAQLPEMYLNFGILGVVIGMYLLAQIYRILSHLFNQPKSGVWGIVPAALIFTSLSQIESNFSLVFGGLPYTILLLYLAMLPLKKRKTQSLLPSR